MRIQVERIFHEVVDLPIEARAQYFAEHGVDDDTRREVEALAAFDSVTSTSLIRDISQIADGVVARLEPKDSRCGPYRLLDLLGQGGMGAVYSAERVDGEVAQRVAVKLLRPGADSPQLRKRFLAERQILATLSHPGIAGLLDAGHNGEGQPYLVMEHIDGTPIDVYAERLDVRGKLTLFIRVCQAVAYAHQNLIVHRDLKPSNILVDAAGEPKLLDFGIAKLLEGEGHSGGATLLTLEGGGALTPEYAAPEQVTGGPVTTATDVYALGVLLYVLLTGQHPAGPGPHSYAELFKAIVETEPPRLSHVLALVKAHPEGATANPVDHGTTPDRLPRLFRGDLDTIVAKALKKNPRERYASVAALADDLQRYLRHEPIAARPDTFAYRTAKFVRRNRVAAALATLALMTSAAGVVGILTEARTARVQRDFALRQLSRAEAISDLNSFVLSDAAPSGKPLTVNELLGRAEEIVQRQRGGNDSSRVELLISIGRQYYAQDEDASANRVLGEAYRLSRGSSERSTRAEASCALASTVARDGDLTRAEALIQEGLREVSGQPQLVLDRVFCLERGSEVARDRGTSQEALARARQAQRSLRESPFQSDVLELHALMSLAESYRTAGQFGEASAAFQQASVLLTALGRDNTQTAGTLFNNWALALHFLGHPLEAERVFRRAIAISSSSDDREQSVSPMLLVNYSRVLRDLGRFTEASGYAERGYAKARQAGDEVVINQSLMMRSAVYRSTGDLTRAATMLSELEPRFRRTLPAGHIAFASLASEKALVAQGQGDLRAALDLSNQAMAIADSSVKAGGDGADYFPILLVRRSDIELGMGRVGEAAADATRAFGMVQQGARPGVFSGTLGHAYLALGRTLRAQGRRDEARTALLSAEEHLKNTLGADHPDTRTARQLADLCTQYQ